MGIRLGRAAVLGGIAGALVVTSAGVAHAVPQNDFEMPFPCGEAWTGSTRDGHSPSKNSIDWNRTDDEGDAVVAAAPGTVLVAEPRGTSGYGHWVRISHSDGENTIYAHLDEVLVREGQTVDQGDLLGTVGSTGNSSGPHLHFEERNSAGVMAPFFSGVKFVFGSTLTSANCVDVPLAGNFVGGPEAEVAVFRRAARATFLVEREGREPKVLTFGTSTDQPLAGDWDGDGRVNPGVRTPGSKTFRLRTPAGTTSIVFGRIADQPIAGDWDGDGLDDVGVRRPGNATFRLRAADGTVTVAPLGDADDLPVTGDWNGDGLTDVGVYDLATATWTLRLVDGDGLAWLASVGFGQPGDLPVTGDWDANGRSDLGVWSPASATFSQRRAASPTSGFARAVTPIVFGNPR